MNIPEITRQQNEEKRAEAIVERAVVTVIAEGPMRARMARGGTPTPPMPSFNAEGEAFFTFGNVLGDGASLAPTWDSSSLRKALTFQTPKQSAIKA